ncbi:single-stranded-DNA-specific exonuclease RecJ [Paenibacillus sp. P96]|uniref:Single-stranded-DNA-specific exonuclease RecJ n=1 Tax=Paenibacillus zeirhizosphaerae TaxID=2987519 RepID=A0ABT9FKE8_9BACL|nr:single-stranded-DNA-specific exonuclease RecJ [Paenibacillus sp. P96]MDP4095200.1 single-stranded-DNA-specific exonuclease RecJ [Paenibacillus sp. P96]
MLQSQYRWRIAEPDRYVSDELARELQVSPLLASLLANRGVDTPELARSFLHGRDESLHDPFLLLGMEKAIPRIREALERKEHILIYGDYDADGVSSTALMIHLMKRLGASYDIYIPHRSNEGYGLHNHALDWAHQQGVSLAITVDTGISAVEQIAYASALGMDVIVTDHHEPPAVLPEAYALINPKLPGCPYPFKGLAGVGVALKLAQAILGEVPAEWFEIAAIGTVADLMPLHDENRTIVRRGIESMRASAFPGIESLLQISGVDMAAVSSVNIAFALAPRINASGRLDHAGRAVALLTTEDAEEADKLAHELDLLNKERQQVVNDIVHQAVDMLEAKMNGSGLPPVIVLAGEGWNVGVVGIVASKLLERYYRPTIILDMDPETGNCKGSARSIPGLDIYEALTDCKELMHHFGGHPSAAGMSLHRDELELFEQSLHRFATARLLPEHFVPVAEADAECRLGELNVSVAEQLELMQPFGMANPSPRLVLRKLQLREARKMGKEKNHLKLVLEQDGSTLDVVAFGRGELADFLQPGSLVDVLGELSINEWNGKRSLQLMLQDIQITASQVFDFRGEANPVALIERYIRIFHQASADQAPVAALVHSTSPFRKAGSLNDGRIWVYDKTGGILPENDSAGLMLKDTVRTVFLLDPPETKEQFNALWMTFRRVENIVVMHSINGYQGRLEAPDREQFKRIYVLLKKMGPGPLDEKTMLPALSRQCSISMRMMSKVLEVFEELGFVHRAGGELSFVPNPPKKELTASHRFHELNETAEMERYLLDAETSQLASWMMSRLKGAS